MLAQSVVDIKENNLHQALEQSISIPVLLYFRQNAANTACNSLQCWRNWQQSMSANGCLAKVDCDTKQMIAAQFGLRSIPAVYLFKDGQPVDGFQGPQSEAIIREFLQRFLPKEEDLN